MASKKALVFDSNGNIQQLQAGDTLSGASSSYGILTLTNGESSASLGIGTPVYVSGNDTVKRGKADALSTSKIVGLCQDASISASATGVIQMDGIFTATTGQWDTITGGSGGLTAGSNYFLDAATAGMLTSSFSNTTGNTRVLVGVAISTTEMQLKLQEPILL